MVLKIFSMVYPSLLCESSVSMMWHKTTDTAGAIRVVRRFADWFLGWGTVFAVLALLSCSSVIIVEGKVAVKGNEPFTFLSIANEFAEYQIVGELEAKIRNELQGRTVRLRGELTRAPNLAKGASTAGAANQNSSPEKPANPVELKNQKTNTKKSFMLTPAALPQFRVFAILAIENNPQKP